MRSYRTKQWLCAFFCVLILAGCAQSTNKATLPNVVLITLDTLRADHLALYGYERDTSPFLDEFAKVSDVYTHCMATSAWTLPTHASIFTGLFPYEHGARYYLGPKPEVIMPPIPQELPMLTEILKEAGYSTISYSSNEGVILPRHGFNRGFDLFRTQWMPSDVLNNYLFRGMKPYLEKDAPFFLFINYLDTHIPYNAEPIEGFLETHPKEDSVEIQQALFKMIVGNSGDIPQDKLQILKDQYDTGIRHVDEALKALVQWLKEQGRYENTLIIITSDHGEFFGEHRMFGHIYELYQEVSHVPLFVKSPGQKIGKTIDTMASSVDIPGMVLDAVSPALAKKHEITFPYRIGNHPVIAESYYGSSVDIYDTPWAERFMKEHRAVWDWPWKLIADSKGSHQLYNLDVDPKESENLYEKEHEHADAMLEKLNTWLGTLTRHTPDLEQNKDLSDEEKEALEHLGYL